MPLIRPTSTTTSNLVSQFLRLHTFLQVLLGGFWWIHIYKPVLPPNNQPLRHKAGRKVIHVEQNPVIYLKSENADDLTAIINFLTIVKSMLITVFEMTINFL